MPNRFLSIDDLKDMPKPRWLIDGLFEVNSLVMLAGPPGSCKSFLVLDWVLSMVTGRHWHGRATAPAKVLYLLGEGKASLLKRIQTWMAYHKPSPEEQQLLRENFRVTFDVPQMASKSSVDNMLAGLAAENFAPTVIVVDTFARSFVGQDENSQKDTGLWVESADRLRQIGYTVIFLHHTAKNVEFGVKYRGSTAIMGAMDTAFTLQKDARAHGRLQFDCTKQKDHDEGDPLYFQKLIVKADLEEDSIVLIPAVRMDERFSKDYVEKEQSIEKHIEELTADPAYRSDRARARELSRITGLTEAAAQTKVSRRRRIEAEVPQGM